MDAQLVARTPPPREDLVADEDEGEDWEDRKDTNVVAGEELSDFEKEDDERDELDPQEKSTVETHTALTVEPSYQKFGSIPFSILSKRLEQLWQRKMMKNTGKKRNNKAITLQDMLLNLLPPKMLHTYSQHEPGQPPESIFPLIRLLCPEKDGARRTCVKEMTLAKAYIKAFGWASDKKESRKLLNYHDPAIVGTNGAGFRLYCNMSCSGMILICHEFQRNRPKLPSLKSTKHWMSWLLWETKQAEKPTMIGGHLHQQPTQKAALTEPKLENQPKSATNEPTGLVVS